MGLALAGGDLRQLALPLIGGFLIFIVGVADDVLSLKPTTKLIAEIAVAAMFGSLSQRSNSRCRRWRDRGAWSKHHARLLQ